MLHVTLEPRLLCIYLTCCFWMDRGTSRPGPFLWKVQWNIHSPWCSAFQSLIRHCLLSFNHTLWKFFPLCGQEKLKPIVLHMSYFRNVTEVTLDCSATPSPPPPCWCWLAVKRREALLAPLPWHLPFPHLPCLYLPPPLITITCSLSVKNSFSLVMYFYKHSRGKFDWSGCVVQE